MSDDAEYIKGANLLPWPGFTSPLTDHDRAAIAELAKHERTSPEKASARIAKLKSNLATRKELTAGKRWNSIRCKWE